MFSHDFKGITVDGKSLTSLLADELDEEKSREVAEIRQAQIKIPRGKHKPHARYNYKERSSRTKRLTDNQIRKEYGLMQKPYDNPSCNIIWTILNSDKPLSPKDIAEAIEFDKPMSTFSALMSTMYSALEPLNVIARKPFKTTFQYFKHVGAPENLDAEKLWDEIKIYTREQHRRRAKSKIISPTTSSSPHHLGETLPPVPAGPLVEAIEEAITKVLGIKVEVSGQVNIVIRLG